MGSGKGADPGEDKNATAAAFSDETDPAIKLGQEGDVSSAAAGAAQGGGGKMEMLSNVKSQIEGIGGWLGSSMPSMPSIPKLRKGDAGATGEAATAGITGTDEQQSLDYGGLESGQALATDKPPKDDDDNSSATGGADSGPQSANESPTEEMKDNQFGNAVQNKALAGAKSFGSFLYSAVNKAGAKVSEASAKIKKSVGENSILGEFNKEQEAFARKQAENAAAALPPWTGCTNEQTLKDECLSLSSDTRNFVRSPPAGVDFAFDYDLSYPVAMSIMEQDPNLEKMRYELVPKLITEENFWRNYFYRVSLICQANELSLLSQEGDPSSADNMTSDLPLEGDSKAANIKHSVHVSDFVSDTLQASNQDLVEVEEGMKRLTVAKKHPEEEWERELEAELQDYEMISEQCKSSSSKTDNWEQEIDEMLEEDDDLK